MRMLSAVGYAAVLSIVLSACGLVGGPGEAPSRPELRAALSPTSGQSAPTAVSYLFTTADRSILTIRVSGAAPGIGIGWRLRTGVCTDANGITFGNPSAYPGLVPGEEGLDRTVATFDLPISMAGQYRVELLSRDDPPAIMACGELVPFEQGP